MARTHTVILIKSYVLYKIRLQVGVRTGSIHLPRSTLNHNVAVYTFSKMRDTIEEDSMLVTGHGADLLGHDALICVLADALICVLAAALRL